MTYIVAGTTVEQAQARLPGYQAELNARQRGLDEANSKYNEATARLDNLRSKAGTNQSLKETADLQAKAARYEQGVKDAYRKYETYLDQESDLVNRGYANGTREQKLELYHAKQNKELWLKTYNTVQADQAKVKASLGKTSPADQQNAAQLEQQLVSTQAEVNQLSKDVAFNKRSVAEQQDIVTTVSAFISSGGTNFGAPGAATERAIQDGLITPRPPSGPGQALPPGASGQNGNVSASSSTTPDDRFKNNGQTKSGSEVPGGAGDPSQQRLDAAGLKQGGLAGGQLPTREVPVTVATQRGPTLSLLEDDWRVRISLANSSKLFYKSSTAGIQSALRSTNGVVFPYTPAINVAHTARYGEQKLTHSNYANYFYEGSEVQAITVQGEFSVQTPEEGKYLLAAVMFFRSCTKMFFGKTNQQPLAGSPPPLVFLHGYGKYIFPAVPCVITSFQQTMPGDVDYLEVSHFIDEVNPTGFVNSQGQFKSDIQMLNSAATRVPTNSTLSVTLQPVYSRKTVHEDFNLDRFASGELLVGRGGFI